MKVNLTIQAIIAITLVFIVGVLGMILVLRETQHLRDLEKTTELLEQKEEKHLENLNEFIKNYNELYADYNELNKKYTGLAGSKGFYEGWEDFEVTGYTQNDEGVNNITSIGLDLNKDWTKYFNFCAVDPTIIPYGSIVLVKFKTGIESFLSADCGGAIKGRHIDLYFGSDLSSAFEFGKKTLEVKVIK